LKVNDAVGGAVFLAAAAAIALYARTLPAIPGQQYGAGAFPTLIAAGFAGCGLWLTVQGVRARASQPLLERAAWMRRPRAVRNLFATLALVLAYVLFSEAIGFVPIALAILFCLFVLLGVRPLPALGIAAAATLLIHAAFYKLLRVPLPWGVLEPFAW
jgi:putative tricarboxylic transport membrane protein